MNDEEIKWVQPGQLFQLWSGNKRGLIAILSKEGKREGDIVTTHVNDGTILMLVNLPENLRERENLKWLHEAGKILELESEECEYYEFLMGERLIILNKRQLGQLSEAY